MGWSEVAILGGLLVAETAYLDRVIRREFGRLRDDIRSGLEAVEEPSSY